MNYLRIKLPTWFKSQRVLTSLFIVVATFVLAWLVWKQWPGIITFKWELNGWWLTAAALLYLLGIVLAVFGCQEIFSDLAPGIPFKNHLRIFASNLIATRIPGAPWHIAGRVTQYIQLGFDPATVSYAILLEQFMILVCGVFTGFLFNFSLYLKLSRWNFIWLGLVLILCVIIFRFNLLNRLLLFFFKKIPPKVISNKVIFRLFIIYTSLWVVGGIIFYSLASGITHLSLSKLLPMIGIWSFSGSITNLPIFGIANFGTRELLISALLTAILPVNTALILAIFTRIYLTIADLLIGVSCFFFRPKKG